MPVDIHAEIKKAYFDSVKVQKLMDRKTLRAMNRIGGRLRKTAQFSMKPGGKKGATAKPGEPPRTHGQKLLRKLLYYSYDEGKKIVVVGPIRIRTPRKNQSYILPQLMEQGGIVHDIRHQKPIVKRYRPHPFMNPALTANQDFIIQEFGGGL